MAKQLWNIGTPQNPIIQGQDGLPFYHQSGGWRRFGSNSSSYSYVNNDCLCKCHNYVYYVNYIHLGQQKRKIFRSDSIFKYQDFVPTSNSVDGLAFNQSKLYCIKKYKPSGTYETGISLIPELPYSKKRKNNITTPCPQYYRRDSPFNSPATTIKRYINTYGSSDCGVPIFSNSSQIPQQALWYWALFDISKLGEKGKQPVAIRIPGTEGASHSLPPVKQYVKILDCHRAEVLALITSPDHPFDYSDSGPNGLMQTAINAAKRARNKITCVYWTLYEITIDCCYCKFEEQKAWRHVRQFWLVPAQVWGEGDGLGIDTWHSTKQMKYAQGSTVTIYKWVKDQTKYPGPVPDSITQSPCQQICSIDYSISFRSDSQFTVSCSGSHCPECPQQPPCNIRENFPYFYRSTTDYPVVFPTFNIWRKQFTEDQSSSWFILNRNLYDWELVPEWDGKAKWARAYRNIYEDITAVQILVDTLDEPSAQIQYDRLHNIWDPQQEQEFYDTHFNYWQVYFHDKTETGICDPPRLVARMKTDQQWERISYQHRVCLDHWQPSSGVFPEANRVFSQDSFFPYGSFVYTFKASARKNQLCYKLGDTVAIIYEKDKSNSSWTKEINLPTKGLAIHVIRFKGDQILSQQPLYITTNIDSADILFGGKHVESDSKCLNTEDTGYPMFEQGWYQEPRSATPEIQGELLNTTYWADAFNDLPTLIKAHTDENGILTPGRKQSGQPICQLFYILPVCLAWDKVYGDGSGQTLEELWANFCSDGYVQCYNCDPFHEDQPPDPRDYPGIPEYVNWQPECHEPTPYGLRVYVIGPAVFPGVEFEKSNIPEEFWPSGIHGDAYTVDSQLLFQYVTSDSGSRSAKEIWQQRYGNANIASGFYTTQAALPLASQWLDSFGHVIIPSGITGPVTLSPSSGACCVHWQLQDSHVIDPISKKCSLPWRIYIAFGYQNGINRLTDICKIAGQNSSQEKWIGLKLHLDQRVCSLRHGRPANAIDKFIMPNSPTSDDYVIHRYLRNHEIKKSDLGIAPYTACSWSSDSYPTPPTGFVVPDETQGIQIFGKKLNNTYGVEYSQPYIIWNAARQGQQYGGEDKCPWWVFSQRYLLPVFDNKHKLTCDIFDKQFIEIEQHVFNNRRHARVSPNTYTQIAQDKVLQDLRDGSISFGDDNIYFIYAPMYLIQGKYDSLDLSGRGETGFNRDLVHAKYSYVATYEKIRHNYTFTGECDDMHDLVDYGIERTGDIYSVAFDVDTPGLGRQIQGTWQRKHISIRGQESTSGSDTWTSLTFSTYSGYGETVRGNSSDCIDSSDCLDPWYIFFPVMPGMGLGKPYDYTSMPAGAWLPLANKICADIEKIKLDPIDASNAIITVPFHCNNSTTESGTGCQTRPNSYFTYDESWTLDVSIEYRIKFFNPPTSWVL